MSCGVFVTHYTHFLCICLYAYATGKQINNCIDLITAFLLDMTNTLNLEKYKNAVILGLEKMKIYMKEFEL